LLRLKGAGLSESSIATGGATIKAFV